MTLTILQEGDPRLTQVSESVTVFDEALYNFGNNLVKTMIAANGAGLAAPQVGELRRIIAVDEKPFLYVNPVIMESDGEITAEEGCLSFPGLFMKVKRARHVKVEYQTVRGEARVQEYSGFLAVVFQHEIDHLDGKLFITRVRPMDLALARKRLHRN